MRWWDDDDDDDDDDASETERQRAVSTSMSTTSRCHQQRQAQSSHTARKHSESSNLREGVTGRMPLQRRDAVKWPGRQIKPATRQLLDARKI